MATGACLHVVAARLHVPKKGLTQSNGRGFVGQDSVHAEHRRNRNAGKRRHWPERKNDLASCVCALRANVPVPISRQLFTAQVSVFGPALSRVYQPKPNNYAEKFQHSIEPFFNLSWNSPFHDAARIVQLDPSVDGLVGGTVSTLKSVSPPGVA
jgi:hypothetical protein